MFTGAWRLRKAIVKEKVSMFPIIPLVCVAGFIASAIGLTWYDSLSQSEKEDADKLAADYAWQLYRCSVKNLTADQAHTVATLVKNRLYN